MRVEWVSSYYRTAYHADNLDNIGLSIFYITYALSEGIFQMFQRLPECSLNWFAGSALKPVA